MYCPECGFHQSDAHKYCSRCGALLIVENQGTGEITGPFAISDQEAETGAWQGPAIEGPTLAVRSGGPPGAIFTLDRETVTIGREPSADVFLDDVTVSRNHAVIVRAGGGVSLRDLGSLNGTYVNRRRIEAPTPLEHLDEIGLGTAVLTVRRLTDSAATQTVYAP
jgi:pSer/pThr/pTyr-binding forkhead associated (FHA) protein